MHWAEKLALEVIQRNPNKEEYVCAAGISPSGSVHIGNFRDIATSYYVVKALRKMGKKARLLFSWDEFDRLRKVPSNVAPICPDFDKYLGCGVTTNRPSSYEKAKTPFQYAVKKYGVKNFIRKTLIVLDTLEEALKMEALIVNEAFIRRDDTYNVALGGGSPVDASIELYQYDFEGVFIKSWKSSVDAANYFNGASNHIRNCVLTKNSAYGYF